MAGAPELRKRWLAAELTALRLALGLSQEDAERRLRLSRGALSKIENGSQTVQLYQVELFLELYNVTDPEQREYLTELALEASGPDEWTQRFGKKIISPAMRTLLGCEAEAANLRIWQPSLWPGLVQTEDYARNMILKSYSDRPVSEVDQRVELRLKRQRIFDRDKPPKVNIIVGEECLRYAYGGADVRSRQLTHMLEIANVQGSPIEVQVAPFSYGAHAASGTASFTIVDFHDPRYASVVYEETLTTSTVKEKKGTLRQYLEVFEAVQKHALSLQDSRKMIRDCSFF